MTRNRGALLFALVLACAPDGRPPGRPARSAPSGEPSTGPPMPAPQLVLAFRAARLEAADEMLAIVLVLPPDSRGFEASWVLARGSPAQAGRAIEALRTAEVPPLRRLLLQCAGGPDPASRDPAVLLLSAAGVADVQPLVGRALRTEASEGSLGALARAAGRLGPFLPVSALKTALARARTGPALLEITAALGPALDAGALRILASRGAAAGPALDLALRLLRGAGPASNPAGIEARPAGASTVGPEAVAILRARAAAIAEADADRDRAVCRWLGRRLGGQGPEAAAAAEALGAIGSRMAAAELVGALEHADRPLAAAISSALASALRVAPAKTPADPRELRRAWFPILATLFPDENGSPSNRP